MSHTDTESELRELAILSQKGDKDAYRSFLKKIMGIHKNLASYHPSQPIKPWISAIIRYKLADHFRRLAKRKEQFLGDDMLDVTMQAEDTNNPVSATQREASEVLNALPEKLRRALEMTHIEGLTYSEAAEKEGISEVALRKRISRAFNKVKTEVSKSTEISIE